MGLALEVGILVDLEEHDPEGRAFYEASFAATNELLRAAGLPPHDEPTDCEVWSAEMFGYSGLHYLRRVAVHLDAGNDLPQPGAEETLDDPLIERHLDDYLGKGTGLLGRLSRKRPRFARGFDHLLVHSDTEGFYLPQDFDQVLIDPEQHVPGGMLGSTPRLLAELDRLASRLEIPDALDAESDALWQAAESQGEGDAVWERFGMESYACVVLREGCRRSLATGAALVFS
jgi:hypothetical protein